MVFITFVLAITLLGACEATAATVHQLPNNPLPAHPNHSSFRLHPYQAKGRSGKKLKVVAHLMDIFVDNGNGFNSPSAASVPTFLISIPANIERHIQLFYSSGKYGSSTGWLVAPTKWRPWDAGMGSLGESIDFASPQGPDSGWMRIGISYCRWTDCVIRDVAGLLPEAMGVLNEAYRHRRWHGTMPPESKVVPTPVSIRHPNPCAAIFKYRYDGKLVYGAVLLGDDEGLYDETLYVSDDHAAKGVLKYIVRTFIKIQTKRDYTCPAKDAHKISDDSKSAQKLVY